MVMDGRDPLDPLKKVLFSSEEELVQAIVEMFRYKKNETLLLNNDDVATTSVMHFLEDHYWQFEKIEHKGKIW